MNDILEKWVFIVPSNLVVHRHVLFHETMHVFVFLLNEPQTCLELFDSCSLFVLIMKFHQIFADVEPKVKHLLIIVFQLFLNALF